MSDKLLSVWGRGHGRVTLGVRYAICRRLADASLRAWIDAHPGIDGSGPVYWMACYERSAGSTYVEQRAKQVLAADELWPVPAYRNPVSRVLPVGAGGYCEDCDLYGCAAFAVADVYDRDDPANLARVCELCLESLGEVAAVTEEEHLVWYVSVDWGALAEGAGSPL